MNNKKLLCIILSLCLVFSLAWNLAGKTAPPPPVTDITEATAPTESLYKPYTGNRPNYLFYYEKGRARDWEEDILYMTDTFLEIHPYLTPEESRVTFRKDGIEDGYYTDEFYDHNKRQAFLDGVNELIPELQDLEDTQILYRLQKIVATLKDGHASVYLPSEKMFPFLLIPVTHRNQVSYRVCVIPKSQKEFLMAELLAINDVPVEEIVRDLLPYVSSENIYWARTLLADPEFGWTLVDPYALQEIGVLDRKTKEASFSFRLKNGDEITKELDFVSIDTFEKTDLSYAYYNHSPRFRSPSETTYYWYEVWDDIIYLRIDAFETGPNGTLRKLGNDLLSEGKKIGFVPQLIVDLRHNPGGYSVVGYDELIPVLQRMDIGTIYVIFDNGSFSKAVLCASAMANDLDNAVLIGEPAGQPPNFFGNVVDYKMPNTGNYFRLASDWYIALEDYPHNVLMPDILVEQTPQDYLTRKDTVINYIMDRYSLDLPDREE